MRKWIFGGMLLSLAGVASADIRITEWMYQGASGEFIEFTNVGNASVDMAGWSFDDDTNTPGSLDLSAFGVVPAGHSVIVTEAVAADFIAAWGLAGVPVIGGNANNLGRNDQINLYDSLGVLADRLTYGDQNFAGSPRTQNRSGNPISPASLGANNPLLWQLATAGDAYGSYASAAGDIGNPGVYVPEPTSLVLLALGGVALVRRR